MQGINKCITHADLIQTARTGGSDHKSSKETPAPLLLFLPFWGGGWGWFGMGNGRGACHDKVGFLFSWRERGLTQVWVNHLIFIGVISSLSLSFSLFFFLLIGEPFYVFSVHISRRPRRGGGVWGGNGDHKINACKALIFLQIFALFKSFSLYSIKRRACAHKNHENNQT